MLSERLGRDDDARRHIEREAKAISRLNHPHICTLYDSGAGIVSGTPEAAARNGVRAYFLPDNDKATLYVYRTSNKRSAGQLSID